MSPGVASAAALKGRLSIGHLLGWVAGCAVGIAVCRASHPRFNERFRPVGDPADLVMGVAFGTCLTGVGLMILRRRRGERTDGDTPPGRWLLVLGVVGAAADRAGEAAYDGVATFVLHLAPDSGAYPPPCLVMFRMGYSPGLLDPVHQAVAWSLGGLAAVATAASLRRRLRGLWLVVFLIFAASAFYLASGSALALADLHRGRGTATLLLWSKRVVHDYARLVVACLVALAAAVAWDGARRWPTDGLHWAGVGAWAAIGAIQLVLYAHER